MSDDMIQAFKSLVGGAQTTMSTLSRHVAKEVGVEYIEGNETERVLNVRHDGRWVPSGIIGSRHWDHGADYAEEHYPDNYNDVPGALLKVGRPLRIWYHGPSMNLVIEDETQKVGVRSTSLIIPLIGARAGAVETLIKGLQDKLSLH